MSATTDPGLAAGGLDAPVDWKAVEQQVNAALACGVIALPDSRLRKQTAAKGAKQINGVSWQPIFCANCGTPGGLVPEENCTFAFYLCNSCAETHGAIAGTYMEPDDVFYARVASEQLEQYGRILSPDEVVAELGLPDSPLSRLARERRSLTPNGSF